MDTDTVDEVLAVLRAAPARLDGCQLLCIDGPAGSGKTTLATQIATLRPEATVLHMDDVYDGWQGLADAAPRLRTDVLEPLAAGRPGRYRRFDWVAGAFAEWHQVPPGDLLIEGVGSGHPDLANYRSLLVWVEAPDGERQARGLARDRRLHLAQGLVWDEAEQRRHWSEFVTQERAFFAEHRVREHADVHVEGVRRRA